MWEQAECHRQMHEENVGCVWVCMGVYMLVDVYMYVYINTQKYCYSNKMDGLKGACAT